MRIARQLPVLSCHCFCHGDRTSERQFRAFAQIMNRKKETYSSPRVHPTKELHGPVPQLDRPLPPGEGRGEGLVQSVRAVRRIRSLPNASRTKWPVRSSTFNIQHSTFNSFQRRPTIRSLGPVFILMLLVLSCTAHRESREHLEFWGLGREGEVVKDLIPEFERRNPGIKVTVQQIPWTAAHEKLLTADVGESTPDLAQMGNTWIPEFVAMRALADLGPFADAVIDKRDYFAGVWDTNVVGRVLYGIPWYVDTRVVFYRTDILAP